MRERDAPLLDVGDDTGVALLLSLEVFVLLRAEFWLGLVRAGDDTSLGIGDNAGVALLTLLAVFVALRAEF